jgi:hypothetical protein
MYDMLYIINIIQYIILSLIDFLKHYTYHIIPKGLYRQF